MHIDVNVIANACRQRHKTHSRSLFHRQSDHFRDWLTSRGVNVYPDPDWTPPQYYYFYKVSMPKTPPKVGNTVELSLIPAVFVSQIGRSTYISDYKGHLRLTIRLNTVHEVYSMDEELWYDVVATVTFFKEQKIAIPEIYQKCLDYVPVIGDHLRFIYNPNLNSSAILSHSKGMFGRTIKEFFPPYLHFDTCIACQNKTHQIGYIISDGPRFDTIDRLEQNSNANVGQSFNYFIDKVVCAKDSRQLTTITRQSFRLKIEILSIQAERSIIPDYSMVIGRVRDCSPVDLRPDASEFLARDSAETDTSLFLPGTYVYIDHYRKEQSPQNKSTNPYRTGSEIAQICYIIGPGTPEFGACPIRPFS